MTRRIAGRAFWLLAFPIMLFVVNPLHDLTSWLREKWETY